MDKKITEEAWSAVEEARVAWLVAEARAKAARSANGALAAADTAAADAAREVWMEAMADYV